MPVDNAFVADRLDEIADLLEVQDANPFRVRAYRNAARTVRRYGKPVCDMIAAGEDLDDLPGIGADLAGKIGDCVRSGTIPMLAELRREVPRFVVELLDIPAIGPKRAMALWRDLGIRNREQLQAAARDGRIRGAPHLGKAVESSILERLAKAGPTTRRMPLVLAAPVAEALRARIAAAPGVDRVVVAGSFRRGRETVGDVDVLATATDKAACIDALCTAPDVAKILARGDTKATIVLASGLQVDLRVVAPAAFGSALQYFTGSKAHSIAVRAIALKKGLKLNEYGVFRDTTRIAGETEESVYAAVGLPFIAPELRENRGEIEAALAGTLPELVAEQDLRGDLHVHCRWDDAQGADALCRAAKTRGLAYLGLADVASRLSAAGADALAWASRLAQAGDGVRVLRVVECDIGEDGRLDLPEALRAHCDIVIGAVHSRFDLPRERQTERVRRALEDPALSIVSHPSRSLVPRDEPYDVDMQSVIRAAAACRKWVEITADPARLDIGDLDCRIARDAGVLVSVSSEASAPEGLGDIRFALEQARRGWLTRADVLNARPLPALLRLLGRASGPASAAHEPAAAAPRAVGRRRRPRGNAA